MKKIIFLDRIKQKVGLDFFDAMSGIEMFTAYSNDDALSLHRREKASLIITELFSANLNARDFCSAIRNDEELRNVSIIVCCRDNGIELKMASQCRANAVLTLPFKGAVLLQKARQLLNISDRGRVHVQFSARTSRVPGTAIECRAENISVTGMLIKADAELRRGDLLQYTLSLGPAPFAMQGEVVRSGQGSYGIQFSSIGPAARSAIAALVGRDTVPSSR